MYKVIFCDKQLSAIDFSCSYKDRAMSNFNHYVMAIGFKSKKYKNGLRKIWLSKTDLKYIKPFLLKLQFESIPFKLEGNKK